VKPFEHPVAAGLTETYICVTRKSWACSNAASYKTPHNKVSNSDPQNSDM